MGVLQRELTLATVPNGKERTLHGLYHALKVV